MNRIHLYLSGKVQGVYFRAYTKQEADALHITGWVKNTSDGRVEIVAEGEKEHIDSFLEWCREGPPQAHVSNTQIQWQNATDEFNQFSIIR